MSIYPDKSGKWKIGTKGQALYQSRAEALAEFIKQRRERIKDLMRKIQSLRNK